MPAERVRWLNVWAAETDRTVSDVVLEALDHYIGEVERVHGKYRGFVNESGEAEVPSKGVRGLEQADGSSIRARGYLPPDVTLRAVIRIGATWTQHAQYGWQIQVRTVEIIDHVDRRGVVAFWSLTPRIWVLSARTRGCDTSGWAGPMPAVSAKCMARMPPAWSERSPTSWPTTSTALALSPPTACG
jgi:hypothetical protein